MCMHLPLFSGNWPQDVLLLMVSLSITADYVHDGINVGNVSSGLTHEHVVIAMLV